MIYLTNRKLLKQFENLTKEEAEKIIGTMEVLIGLFKRYGKKLNSASFLEVIKKQYEELYELILFLKSVNKFKLQDLRIIVEELKKRYGLDKSFIVKIYDESKMEDILKVLKEKFGEDIKIDSEKYERLGMFVKGAGYYYKRDLKSDLDKLLK